MEKESKASCCGLPYYGDNHSPLQKYDGMTVCRACNHVHEFRYGTYIGPGAQEVTVKEQQLIIAGEFSEQFVDLWIPVDGSETTVSLTEAAYMLRGFKFSEKLFLAAES